MPIWVTTRGKKEIAGLGWEDCNAWQDRNGKGVGTTALRLRDWDIRGL